MESNKSIRNRSVDENYNIGLDEALTMMLSRVKQFAPTLLAEKIKDSKNKIIKMIFPKIRIDNVVVEKKKGQTVFKEAIGKYGYFELKPDVVQGVGVKVTTPSTNSIIPILERQKIQEFVTNISMLANVAALDQTGETTKKLLDFAKLDELMNWMSDAYGYDINSIKAQTAKDKIAKENIDMIDKLKEFISGQSESLSPNQPMQNAQVPSQDMGQVPQMTDAFSGGGFNQLEKVRSQAGFDSKG